MSKTIKVGLIPAEVRLTADDDKKPHEEEDPRDHSIRQREFISLGSGSRMARRLPVV